MAGWAENYLGQALQQPYSNMPMQPVPGLSPTQTAAIQAMRERQGAQDPAFAQAQQMAFQSGQPIDMGQVSDLYKQLSDPVFASMSDLYGQQFKQATDAGVGASGGQSSRIPIAQANLLKQQQLAAGQTGSSLMQQAINTYLAQRQAQLAGGFGEANIAGARQGASLQDISGLLGVGGLERGVTSEQLMAPYQWALGQFQYPSQLASLAGGLTSQMAPALGGTKAGTEIYPEQSLLSQIAGLGMTGVGLAGGLGWKPFATKPAARGGRIDNPYESLPGYQAGGFAKRFEPFEGMSAIDAERGTDDPIARALLASRFPDVTGNRLGLGEPWSPTNAAIEADRGSPETAMAFAGPEGAMPPGARPTSGLGPIPSIGGMARSVLSGLGAQSGTMASNPWTALMMAGLGTMAASGQRDARGLPMPGLAAIGKGGMAGVDFLQQQQAAALKERAFQEQLKQHGIQAGFKERETAVEEAKLKRPFRLYTDPKTFLDVYGISDPKSPSGYRILGPEEAPKTSSGQPVPSTPAGTRVASINPAIMGEAGAAYAWSSRESHDYSEGGAPVQIQKGTDVPPPVAVGSHSPESIVQNAENYIQTGPKALPVVRGTRGPVAADQKRYRDAVENYANSLLASRGITPEKAVEMWRTQPGMLRWLLGVQGRSATAMGTTIRHLDTLENAYKAMEMETMGGAGSNIQFIRQAKAAFARQFGEVSDTSLNAARKIVGTEIIKALGVAGGGTQVEREEAANAYAAKLTPQQFMGTKTSVQELLAGQLEGRQGEAANVGVSEEQFRRQVGEGPYKVLTGILQKQPKGEPAAAPASGKKLRRVIQGGNVFEEQPDGSMKFIGRQ